MYVCALVTNKNYYYITFKPLNFTKNTKDVENSTWP